MLTEVERYTAVFPKLDWMYCGQLPITIQTPGSGDFGNAVPDCVVRDSCRSLLERMFGMGYHDREK